MKRVLLGLAMGLAAWTASAGPVEDAFRGFLDGLKRAGQQVQVFVPGLVGRPVRTPYIMDRVDALPLGQRTVVVFVSDRCGSCLQAIEATRGISSVQVEVMDVSSSAVAREAFAHTRAGGFPAVMVKAQIMVGYDAGLLQTLLGRAGMWDQDAGRDKP